jgi:hypothetical protein
MLRLCRDEKNCGYALATTACSLSAQIPTRLKFVEFGIAERRIGDSTFPAKNLKGREPRR